MTLRLTNVNYILCVRATPFSTISDAGQKPCKFSEKYPGPANASALFNKKKTNKKAAR